MKHDPRQGIEVLREHDIRRGYAELHYQSVLRAFDRGFDPNPGTDQLNQAGHEVVPVMGRSVADRISDHAGKDAKDLGRKFTQEILESCFNDNVTKKIQRYFNSDFAPVSIHIVKTTPKTRNASFKWHCIGLMDRRAAWPVGMNFAGLSGEGPWFAGRNRPEEFKAESVLVAQERENLIVHEIGFFAHDEIARLGNTDKGSIGKDLGFKVDGIA